jgi:hypothetical protein
MNDAESESPRGGGTVTQVMSDRMIWFDGTGDLTEGRVLGPQPATEAPPLTEEERVELEAWIAQTRSQPSKASREALAEIDKLVAELGDAGGAMSSIRERICRIRSLLAQG